MNELLKRTLGAAALTAAFGLGTAGSALAYTSDDGSLELNGFVENATYVRKDRGLTKFRNTAQMEIAKTFDSSIFSRLSFNATLRGTYDGVYDLNKGDYGKAAGSAVSLGNSGIPTGPGTFGPGGPTSVPFGQGLFTTGLFGFGFDTTANPNQGLELLGQDLHGGLTPEQVGLAVPVRPCNIDPRGCLDGYMDASLNDLRYPEFNSRWDFLREAYVDASLPFDSGHELSVRLGRQQVVWGRTDLFRVLDVINPVDFSRHNIYDELEDIRIPQWMINAEYRMGAAAGFEDLNFSVVWNFDKFRPANLGQAGTPYQILGAGSLFRALGNCWDYGCTVGNFAGGLVATDFGPNQIGIRDVNLPGWELDNTQIGGKVEGVYNGVGFSLNYLTYLSQLPSLHGGTSGPASDNPFTPAVDLEVTPYLIAFDVEFPRIHLFGGSMDIYADSIKSVFRVEVAYTTGEEFANTLDPRLYSESDVLRYVVGWDRDTFIPFLNRTKAFLLSAQVFGQHLLDHELETRPAGVAGIPDWKDNWIATFLVKGWWMQNRLSAQIISAYDIRAEAVTFAPSVDWLINDNWRLIVGANFKVGEGARSFDDCRSCNPYPPYTAKFPEQPLGYTLGLGGYEPLGRFRSGPIGMAQAEDEIQVTLRYRF